MSTFDGAARLIRLLREGMANGTNNMTMVDWAKEESIKKVGPKRKINRKAPSDEHRVVCCHYPEFKDQNQLKNIALRVAQPSGIRALDKPGRSGKFTGFIEMETPELASTLLSQIQKDEANCEATWANGKT